MSGAAGPAAGEYKGHRRFAAFWDWAVRHERAPERAMRRRAAAGLTGKVLEVGVGVGANWPYLAEGVDYTGIEPDPYMLARSARRAAVEGVVRPVRQGRAEDLGFADETFDAVLVTLTLCSVDDQERALAEAKRVLKPGGQLAFFEHVRPEGRVSGRLFDAITPLWRRIGAGCHPNRRTVAAIAAAGFEVESLRKRRVNGVPMVVGRARKPEA